MGFQKKKPEAVTASNSASGGTAEGPKSPRGYADGSRYARAAEGIQPAIDQLEAVKKGLLAGAAEVTAIEEERRREGETYAFNLKMKRDAQLAIFAKEDEKREADFAARETALSAAETDFGELVGVTPTAGDHLATGKALRTAYETTLKGATAAGEKAGKEAAQAAYNIQKKVDDANASTTLKLLEQKVATLEAANAKLEAANQQLAQANQRLTDQNADVAKTGLNAAGGVVSQGNQALNTAAGAFPGGSRRTGG